MFFLGMSAHLFIYLLVPAFLIVCFYFRGAAGSPEVDPILPEAVVYQQTGTSSFEKAYFYQVEKQEQKTYSKAEVFCIIGVLLYSGLSAQQMSVLSTDSTYNIVRELQEVVVTAEKRELNPGDIPTALTVITPRSIPGENNPDLRNIS